MIVANKKKKNIKMDWAYVTPHHYINMVHINKWEIVYDNVDKDLPLYVTLMKIHNV